MKTHSPEELEAMFHEMGLSTPDDRKRFLFEAERPIEVEEAQVQIFIRLQASTLPEERAYDAELA